MDTRITDTLQSSMNSKFHVYEEASVPFHLTYMGTETKIAPLEKIFIILI